MFTDSGVAANSSGTLQLSAGSDLRVDGDITMKINTSQSAVNETFKIGLSEQTLSLPAGPYLRMEGQSVSIFIADQEISGNFIFEQIVLNGNNRLLIGGSDLVMGFGDNQREILSVSEGSGYFILFENVEVNGKS
mgnify:FL=1